VGYNDTEIDHSIIVWARDMGAAKNVNTRLQGLACVAAESGREAAKAVALQSQNVEDLNIETLKQKGLRT
jgi:hypothetical protein